MKVINIHERELQAPCERIGALVDSLSSPQDALWPLRSWPRMKLDRPLSIGATGGHGPIRYIVESYTPGIAVSFRFTSPKGFNGHHGYAVVRSSDQSCVLRHTLEMTTHGPALIAWPLVFRPLHDALLDDSLAVAQASLGLTPRVRTWSPWVRLLRRLVSGGRAGPQVAPNPTLQRTASGGR